MVARYPGLMLLRVNQPSLTSIAYLYRAGGSIGVRSSGFMSLILMTLPLESMNAI